MSETQAAFDERTVRSLKNKFYHYMDDYGYKYIHKLYQFVTTVQSRNFYLKHLRTKKAKNSDFLYILDSKPLREYRKPMFRIGDRFGNQEGI